MKLLSISTRELYLKFCKQLTILSDRSIIETIASALSAYCSSPCFEHGDRLDSSLRVSEINFNIGYADTTLKGLRKYASTVSAQLRGDVPADSMMMPVVAYYRTDIQLKPRKMNVHNPLSRTMGYKDCLSPEFIYHSLAEWMERTTFALIQELDTEYIGGNPIHHLIQLDTVSEAIREVFHGQYDLRYSIAEDKLHISKTCGGSISPVMTNTILMVGDIAHRCIRLNPAIDDAPSKTHGIVLIEGLDRTWIKGLQRAFPSIQFICTIDSKKS